MQVKLSQKERMLLEDGKKQEELCVKKYQGYAAQVKDVQLKNLMTEIAQEEQHHYDMIDQMLKGMEPNMAHSGGTSGTTTSTSGNIMQKASANENDQILLEDLLSTEKYVSSFYDTTVFESANPTVRQAIQHIQTDEQNHGEKLFNYMNSHGMYNVK